MVMSKAGVRRPPPGVTRDDFELSNCLSEFGRYKSDPKTNHFRVFFIARAYRCEARQSALSDVLRAQRLLVSKFAKSGPKPTLLGAPWDLSAKLVSPKEKYDPDFKGKKEQVTSYQKTFTVPTGAQGEQELRFLTAAKDAEMKVAVQLATSPAKLITGAARTCDDWDASEVIVRQRFVTPTFAAPPAGAPASPAGPQARQSVSVSVPSSFIWEGMPFKSNVAAYLRVVPVAPSGKSIVKGVTKYRCVGGPSPWIKVDVSNVSAAIQEGIEQKTAQAAAYKNAKAAVLGPDPTGKSPINVEVLSYLPRTDHYALPPEATISQLVSQYPQDENYLNCKGQTARENCVLLQSARRMRTSVGPIRTCGRLVSPSPRVISWMVLSTAKTPRRSSSTSLTRSTSSPKSTIKFSRSSLTRSPSGSPSGSARPRRATARALGSRARCASG